jgi:hypothetical protein
MIGSLKYSDQHRPGATRVEVIIDEEMVDTLITDEAPHEGMELESEAISRALEGRRVVGIFFLGNRVTVRTESE